jgi:hypothetical protein
VAIIDDFLKHLRTHYTAAPGEFPRLLPHDICETLQLRETGRERGTKGQPPTTSTDLDTVERDIAEAMRRQASIDQKRTREELDHYEERLKGASPAGDSASMILEAEAAVGQFKASMLQARVVLDPARKSIVEREKALLDFKIENGLRRPPHPPRPHWFMSLVIAVCLCGEIGLNSSVLSTGSEFGILGGIISASLYTFLSMSLSFVLGIFCATKIAHRASGWKIFGVLSGTLVFLAIVFFNLLAAHYRVAITSGIPEFEAAKTATRTLFSDPLLFLSDSQGVLMVGLASVVALITAFEGFYWQDPYPGYARTNRFKLQAERRWIERLMHQRSDLEEIYANGVAEIRDLQIKLGNRQGAIPSILGSRQRLVESFNNHLGHLEETGQYLIAAYREANVETRRTGAPKYFKQVWLINLPMMEIPAKESMVPTDVWTDVGDKLLAASKALKDAHDEAIAWIEELTRSASAADADAALVRRNFSEGTADATDRSSRPTLSVVGEDA